MNEKDSSPQEPTKKIEIDYGIFGKFEVIDLAEETSSYAAAFNSFSSFRF